MIKMNKKATMLYYPLIIGLMLAFAMFFLFWGNTDSTVPGGFIGQRQLRLINSSYTAFEVYNYIDSAASFSSQSSFHELALSGGFTGKESECGKYGDLNLWTKKGKECYPSTGSLKRSLGISLQEKLDLSIEDYNRYLKLKGYVHSVPLNNYEFVFDNSGNVKGISIRPVIFYGYCAMGSFKTGTNIPQYSFWIGDLSGPEIQCVRYAIKPSFSINSDFSLEYFDYLKESAESFIGRCSIDKELEKCVVAQMELLNDNPPTNLETNFKSNLIWSIGSDCSSAPSDYEKRIIPLCVSEKREDGGTRLLASIGKDSSLVRKDLLFKFALYIPDATPPKKVEDLVLEQGNNNGKIMLKSSWKKNSESDMASYEVYCSITDFTEGIGEREPALSVKHKSQDTSQNSGETDDSIETFIPECEGSTPFDGDEGTVYHIAVIPLDDSGNGDYKDFSTSSFEIPFS